MQGNSLRCACFPTFHSMADDVDDSFAGPACAVAVRRRDAAMGGVHEAAATVRSDICISLKQQQASNRTCGRYVHE